MRLFFPSHDIALGNGVRHFNPPAAALSLQEDLAWLEEIWNQPDADPLPWGWDWDTREYLARERHVPRQQLPTDEQLEQLRQLSSRRTSITILQQLGFERPMPRFLDSEDALDAALQHQEERFVLKTPWSSSGRGLIRSDVTPLPLIRQRALATIRRMGGIMYEHWFEGKRQDFAMLFFVGEDEVSFLGYSLFDNEENGTYRQGYLLANEEIERRLGALHPRTASELQRVRAQLIGILNRLFDPFFGLPWQVGYIGIDMMVLADGSIHPCVELNLRCTMGVVARLWSDRHLPAGQSGRFLISPMGDDGHFEAQFLVEKEKG